MQCASSSSEDNIIYMRVLVPILISVVIIVAIAIPNEPKASKACPGFQEAGGAIISPWALLLVTYLNDKKHKQSGGSWDNNGVGCNNNDI